jgi:hypothetical protein
MSSKDPARLGDGESRAAVLLRGYAARTRSQARDDGATWRRLQPALEARSRWRRPWAQSRLLAGAFTVALGLFALARSALLSPDRTRSAAAAERRAMDSEGGPGGGGASGYLHGDSRGAGGMEGASGGACRACDGV